MMGDVRLSKQMCPISMLNVISSYKCPTGNFSVGPGILLSTPCYEIPNPWRSRLALLQILVTNTDKRLFIDVVTFVITKNLDCIYLVIVITWSFQATAMRAGMEYQFQSQHNGMGSLSRWCACQLVFQIHMCTSLSTVESEFIALMSVAQEIVYVHSIWAIIYNVPLGVTMCVFIKAAPEILSRQLKFGTTLFWFRSSICTGQCVLDCFQASSHSF